jgi:hypothetical protein
MEFEKYSEVRDREQLLAICKEVWGGTDYLPTILGDLVSDKRCYSFVIRDQIANQVYYIDSNLTAKGKQVVAFGVIRRETDTNIFNLKAIRTHPKLEGKGNLPCQLNSLSGYCTSLYRFLIDTAKSMGGTEVVYLCRLNNDPMQRIAKRLQFSYMNPTMSFYFITQDKLKPLQNKKTEAWLQTKDLAKVLEISKKIQCVKVKTVYHFINFRVLLLESLIITFLMATSLQTG